MSTNICAFIGVDIFFSKVIIDSVKKYVYAARRTALTKTAKVS